MNPVGIQIGFLRPLDSHWLSVGVKQVVRTASSQFSSYFKLSIFFFFCLAHQNRTTTQPQCSPAQLECFKSFEIYVRSPYVIPSTVTICCSYLQNSFCFKMSLPYHNQNQSQHYKTKRHSEHSEQILNSNISNIDGIPPACSDINRPHISVQLLLGLAA